MTMPLQDSALKAAEANLSISETRRSSSECLQFMGAMIVCQLFFMVVYLVTILAGERSLVPMAALCATCCFHMVVAALLLTDVKKPSMARGWRKLIDGATAVVLVLDTLFIVLARADVQHYIHYKLKWIPESYLAAAYACEEDGDNSGEMAEDACLLKSSNSTHSLALFWVIYVLLFVVRPRYLAMSAITSTIFYVVLGALGSSSLHLEISHDSREGYYIFSDFLWWVMSVGAMLVARVMLDRSRHNLMHLLEVSYQATISEKVLRCEAEFKADKLGPSSQFKGPVSYATVSEQSTAASLPLSAQSAPAYLDFDPVARSWEEACEVRCDDEADGDCLPSDSLVWIDGFSAPRCLHTVLAGERVLCYDSLTRSLKYSNVMDVGQTVRASDTECLTIALEDGTRLQMTSDHPVQCCTDRNATSLTCKVARDLRIGSDKMMVMKMVPVPVQSLTVSQLGPYGQTWKICVQQPQRHMVFVAQALSGSSHPLAMPTVTAVGPSNLVVHPVTHNDNRSAVSAPAHNQQHALSVGHQLHNGTPAQRLPPSSHHEICADDSASCNGNGVASSAASDNGTENGSDGRPRRRKDKRQTDNRVATHLSRLVGVDKTTILKVRHIAALGFDSALILRDHLVQFGKVEEVLLSRSEQETPSRMPGHRCRPSNFCFVVMMTAQGAAAALANGQLQTVGNVQVAVEQFDPQSRSAMANIAEDVSESGTHTGGNGEDTYKARAGIMAPKSSEDPLPASKFWPGGVLRMEL